MPWKSRRLEKNPFSGGSRTVMLSGLDVTGSSATRGSARHTKHARTERQRGEQRVLQRPSDFSPLTPALAPLRGKGVMPGLCPRQRKSLLSIPQSIGVAGGSLLQSPHLFLRRWRQFLGDAVFPDQLFNVV